MTSEASPTLYPVRCRRCGDAFLWVDIDEAFIHILEYHPRVAEILFWDWTQDKAAIDWALDIPEALR